MGTVRRAPSRRTAEVLTTHLGPRTLNPKLNRASEPVFEGGEGEAVDVSGLSLIQPRARLVTALVQSSLGAVKCLGVHSGQCYVGNCGSPKRLK